MNIKWLFGIGIIIGIVAAAYSVMQSSFNFVILSVIGVFIFTNALRAQAFRERGMLKEAKVMLAVSLFCILAFIVFLFLMIMT